MFVFEDAESYLKWSNFIKSIYDKYYLEEIAKTVPWERQEIDDISAEFAVSNSRGTRGKKGKGKKGTRGSGG